VRGTLREVGKRGASTGVELWLRQTGQGLSFSTADMNIPLEELEQTAILKQFNARVMFFFKDTRFDAVRTNFAQVGVGLQFQM
jgi:hypothetical protein